ncbi:non-ribosomal peptide synthetase [Burkholderia ubonensis]|uniref:non-ribosomal peptide synthetase n=1 Tax=Burkholderia ubonensis TaxID=101571 RepID=UPI00075D23B0|nr:non-ribosomal peptide synthetase [Burkholderia ubonensis]
MSSINALLRLLQARNIVLRRAQGKILADWYGAPPDREIVEAMRANRRALEDYLDSVESGREPVDSDADASVVTRAQRRIWFASQSGEGRAAYNVGFRLIVGGTLDVARLRNAVDAALHRYPSLRATFVETPTRLMRTIRAETSGVFFDRTGLAGGRADCERCANAAFDLQHDPLVRVTVCREDGRTVVYVVLHHILTDGIGAQLFIREIFARYADGRMPPPSDFGADTGHARHAALEQRYAESASYEEDLRYWRERLAGYDPRPALPYDFPRTRSASCAVSLNGSADGVERAALHARSRAFGCTPHQLLLACVFTAVRELSGCDDFAICIPVHLRDQAAQFDEMGLFLNVLPIRPRLAGCDSFETSVDAIRRAAEEAYRHKRAPFEDVARYVERGGQPAALLSTMFVHTEEPPGAQQFGGLDVRTESLASPGAKCDFNLFAAECGERARCSLEFDADRFSWLTAEALLERFEAAVRRAVGHEAGAGAGARPAGDALRLRRWRDTVTTLLATPAAGADAPQLRDVAWARLDAPAPVATVTEATAGVLDALLGGALTVNIIEFGAWPTIVDAGGPPAAAFGAWLLDRMAGGVLRCVLGVEGDLVHAIGIVADARCCFGRFGADAIVRDILAVLAGGMPAAICPVPAKRGTASVRSPAAQPSAIAARIAFEWPSAGRDKGWRVAEARIARAPFATTLAALAVTLYRYTGRSDIVICARRPDDHGVARASPVAIDCNPARSVRELREAVERSLAGPALPADVAVGAPAMLDAGVDDTRSCLVLAVCDSEDRAPGAAPGRACVTPERGLYLHLGDGTLRVAVDARHFDASFASRFAASVECVLARFGNPDTRIGAIGACADDDPLGTVRADEPDGGLLDARATLVSRFAEQAALGPDAPALQCGARVVDYSTLLNDTRTFAAVLRDAGVRRGALVAVLLDDPFEYARAVLAVALSGAAYLPLDSDWPPLRLQAVLERAAPDLLIVDAVSSDATGIRKFAWPPHERPGAESDALRTGDTCSPDDLAYVIYTSGSTGVPKGVAMTHGAAINTILDVNRRIGLGAGDAVYAISSFAFDLSVYDLFGALAAGAKVVLPRHGDRLSPPAWRRDLRESCVTVWNSVPALAQMLVEREEDVPKQSLRCVLLSGDRIPVALPDRLRRAFSPEHMLGLGGATEAGIWSIACSIDGPTDGWRSIPYGEPLAGQRFVVLDLDGQRCPRGVPGELHIAGTGLAQGYWRAPEDTARAFFVHGPGAARLYRTGDAGFCRADGVFEILGRLDNRIKLHGYRIEPGEIEAALRQHPGVTDALAWVDGDGAHARLVAAVCTPDGETPASLSSWLAERLPASMRPARCASVPRWPLTPNGKIDMGALRTTERASTCAPSAQPTVTPREASLLMLWRELLDVDASQPLGVHDDFFDVGGHSLLAVRMLERLSAQGATVSYRTFLSHTTVAALGAHLDERGRGQG